MRGTTDGRSSSAWYGGDDTRGEQMRQSALMKLVWWLGVAALFVVIGAMIAAIIVLAVRIDDIDKERGPRGLPGRDGTTLVVPFLNGLYVERVNQTNITTAAYIAGALGFRVQTLLDLNGVVVGTAPEVFGTNYYVKQLISNRTTDALASCSVTASFRFVFANGTQILCTVQGAGAYIFNVATGGILLNNNGNFFSGNATAYACSRNSLNLGFTQWYLVNGTTPFYGGMTLYLDLTNIVANTTIDTGIADVECTYLNV